MNVSYPFIRVWGINMGSQPWYIEEQIELAKKDDAPSRAVFKETASGAWITIDEVQNTDLKLRMEKAVKERYPQWSVR